MCMKTAKKALFYAIFSLFTHTLFAQTSLCNSVYTFLKNNGCKTTTQSLVSTGTNSFPYNISAEFPGKLTDDNEFFFDTTNLYFMFNQEDILSNQEIILPLIEYLKQSDFPFNVNLIFVYGENQLIEKEGIIYGSETFLSALNTNEDSTVIIVNLNQKKSSIVATASGKTAPSWLIKNEHDLFKQEDLSHGLPIYYISQLYSYPFKKDRILDSFFSYDIPAIILNFGQDIETANNISDILVNSVELFSKSENKTWEQHFLMISLFGHYFTLTETTTIKLIVVFIFAFLIFLAIIGFLNKNFQQEAWNKIKKIWYVVPITLGFVFAACYTTKGVCLIFSKFMFPAGKLFMLLGSIILFSFLYISVFYCIYIKTNKNLQSGSLDFILIITIFLNQFIFSIYDVSLFPIFMFICCLSIIAYFVKNNFVHIAIFILMFLPLGIYLHSLVLTYDSNALYHFLISNKIAFIMISILLYPTFLMYLRILEGVKEYSQNKHSFYVTSGITLVIVSITITTVCILRTNQFNRRMETATKNIVFITDDENTVQINYSDKHVFDDLVRTVTISFTKPCYQCDVRIISDETPILYSADSFEQVNTNTAFFKIPYNPPSRLSFSFGTTTAPSKINVTAIFQTNDIDQFSLATKSITINRDGK